MTEEKMLEAEKYWCENCCNWDKECAQMDGYAKCKLTGTMSFAQECGRECRFFNVPLDNVIVLPLELWKTVYCVASPCGGCKCYNEVMTEEFIEICRKCEKREIIECEFDYDLIPEWGKTVFATKEEAEAALRKEDKKCQEER